MRALHMVVQMGGSKECLVAAVVGATKDSFIVMRSDVLCEPGWAVESLVAVRIRTDMRFEVGGIFCGRG
jgi:hypothetical protein